MATSNTTSQLLSGAAGKKRSRKPKPKVEVIKKDSSGVSTRKQRTYFSDTHAVTTHSH